ncbi:unnamed protein product [Rhizoctonia solani]|uniref:Nephrocystin 3-like N-terminal domain-containing protein n=1 Tax=Rhizoctonia solani TaxID=456999 RepID=A0A8H2WGY8_9AGAM|nr:unnamed protein product [Rhizoctonia solani]
MTLKDIIKEGRRKLFKSDSRSASPRTAASPLNASLQIASPTATPSTLLASPPIPLPTTAPTKKNEPEIVTPNASNDSWPSLTTLLWLLNQNALLSPLKVVLDDLSEFVRSCEKVVVTTSEYEVLRTQLELLFKDLGGYVTSNAPPVMTTSVLNICGAIRTELGQLYADQDRNTISRYFQADRDLDNIMTCYRHIQSHIERLTLNANLSIWAIVDRQTTEARLAKITPSLSASYNSAEAALVRRRECTANTRERVILDIIVWKNDQNGEKVCWMSGMAGTGKTTIATSLCSILDKTHELGASFFCARLLPECRNVKLIIPTIAYQLARSSSPFQGALSQALERDPDVHTKALRLQFKHMILEPLQEVARSLPPNFIVTIDALDECEDDGGVEQILDLLLEHASKLPIKFFVSSRPEPHIRERIGKSTLKSQLVLHELEEKMVKADIEIYLREELASVLPNDNQLAALVEYAGVLFIYAATVARYIRSGNPLKRLETVLEASGPGRYSSNKTKEIDALYGAVLTSALSNPDLETWEKEQIELVLRTVVCIQEPLTVDALAGLLKLSYVEIQEALRPLWSVLHVSTSGASSRVSTLHVSFSDYIFDSSRSKHFSCNPEAQNGRLANLCLERIEQNQIQFNICNLESSYIFDQDIPSIDERVNQAIPLDLLYACLYWAVHLNLGEKSIGQAQKLNEFLSTRLLLWAEVLNLTKRMDKGVELMEKVMRWLQAIDCSRSIKLLAQDARRFVTMFSTSPVARSTPHLYVSMLASWPESQPMSRCYVQRGIDLIVINGIATTERQLALLSTIPVADQVNSIKFSPDGEFFVAGTAGGTMFVWDASNYRIITLAHTHSITVIAISPDSTRICSGSWDETLSIWNPRNGQLIVGPLVGHCNGISAVAYSSDGLWVASGSYDGTVRMWNTQTGEAKGDPLEGYDDFIYSVTVSYDDSMVAAGSDSVIYIWDSSNCQLITKLSPAQGHINPTRAVEFLPDRNYLTSGSDDGAVRIWDLSDRRSARQVSLNREHLSSIYAIAVSDDGNLCASGAAEAGVKIRNTPWSPRAPTSCALVWHTGTVTSIGFSPDGLRLVSGSHDMNVCVWDLQDLDGRIVKNVSGGHNDWVRSVAFSPCGTHILSGSDDMTIRTWDVKTGQPVRHPLQGHKGRVIAIKFLANNTHIASVSDDRIICIWNRQSGDLERSIGPVETDGIHDDFYQGYWPVAFSFDGDRIFCGSFSGNIYIWESEELLRVLTGHTERVSSITLSVDERRIISGSWDKTIIMWDASTGEPLCGPLSGHTHWVYSVACSPNGIHIASGSGDMSIRLWNAQNGLPMLEPLWGHTGAVRVVSFAPNSLYLVSGSQDKSVRVWNVNNGHSIAAYNGHTDLICSVALSPDGTQIVSGSADMTIRLWNAPAPDISPRDDSTKSSEESTINSFAPEWKTEDDGWVQDHQQRLIIWVPPDLRCVLLQKNNPIVISRQGCIDLYFSNARIGEAWATCYRPL